jgi:hypothetical protein
LEGGLGSCLNEVEVECRVEEGGTPVDAEGRSPIGGRSCDRFRLRGQTSVEREGSTDGISSPGWTRNVSPGFFRFRSVGRVDAEREFCKRASATASLLAGPSCSMMSSPASGTPPILTSPEKSDTMALDQETRPVRRSFAGIGSSGMLRGGGRCRLAARRAVGSLTSPRHQPWATEKVDSRQNPKAYLLALWTGERLDKLPNCMREHFCRLTE